MVNLNNYQPQASGSRPRITIPNSGYQFDLDPDATHDEQEYQPPPSDDSEVEGKGKGKAKASPKKKKAKKVPVDKAKKRKAKRPVEEEEEVPSEYEAPPQPSSELNNAIIGFAKVNLLDPIRPIRQGVFNPRPISKKALAQLVHNMEVVGVHSDRYSSAIPLLVHRDHVDQSSILTNISKISKAPYLKLSKKGETLEFLTAAGGSHRTEALREVAERLDKKIKHLEESKQKKQHKEELKALKAKKAGLGKWTVILYDEEPLQANGKRLALELSRNKAEVRKVEDDAERTTMSYLAYKSRRKVVVDELAEGQELSIAQKHKIVGEIADDPNIKVCLQSELIVKFWGALESVDGRRFYNTRFFSSKWVINTIHSPGGGLFLEVVSLAAQFFRLLFTPCALWLDETPSRRTEYTRLMKLKGCTSEDEKSLQKLNHNTWVRFDNPEGEPDWSMVPDQLLDELDALELNGLDMFCYWHYTSDNEIEFDETPYWEEVKALLKKHVVKVADGENEVAKNILAKLRWFRNKNFVYERPWIPILTPKMLDELATNIRQRALAYEEIAFWLVPLAPYFATSSKTNNFHARSAWGLVWQHLEVHSLFQKHTSTIRRRLTSTVLQAVTFVSTLNEHLSEWYSKKSHNRRQLQNPRKALAYTSRLTKPEFLPNSDVFEAMLMCHAGTSQDKALTCQPPRLVQKNLPWPLSVPWPGSFLISKNTSRDYIPHAIFADMEKEMVSSYREEMILEIPEIGEIRGLVADQLTPFMNGQPFVFADGIEMPDYNDEFRFVKLQAVLRQERLSASYLKYNTEMEHIVKFCEKRSVMLAHPSGDLDSVPVREAFGAFITSLVNNIPRLIEIEAKGANLNINPYDTKYKGERGWEGNVTLEHMRDEWVPNEEEDEDMDDKDEDVDEEEEGDKMNVNNEEGSDSGVDQSDEDDSSSSEEEEEQDKKQEEIVPTNSDDKKQEEIVPTNSGVDQSDERDSLFSEEEERGTYPNELECLPDSKDLDQNASEVQSVEMMSIHVEADVIIEDAALSESTTLPPVHDPSEIKVLPQKEDSGNEPDVTMVDVASLNRTWSESTMPKHTALLTTTPERIATGVADNKATQSEFDSDQDEELLVGPVGSEANTIEVFNDQDEELLVGPVGSEANTIEEFNDQDEELLVGPVRRMGSEAITILPEISLEEEFERDPYEGLEHIQEDIDRYVQMVPIQEDIDQDVEMVPFQEDIDQDEEMEPIQEDSDQEEEMEPIQEDSDQEERDHVSPFRRVTPFSYDPKPTQEHIQEDIQDQDENMEANLPKRTRSESLSNALDPPPLRRQRIESETSQLVLEVPDRIGFAGRKYKIGKAPRR